MATSSDILLYDIQTSKIKYIEALQNYIKIGYLNSEEKLSEKMLRTTLKQVTSEVKDTAIVKCHRSFLVNREAITATTGNAQGLLLSLSNCDKKVPVSRKYIPIFRNSL